MLEFCAANLVAENEKQTQFLAEIARFSGFGRIFSALSRSDVLSNNTKTHLNFFIFHFGLGMDKVQGIVNSIRHTDNDEVRFAPIILIANDIDFDHYMKYIEIGFDDIISLPESGAMILSRMSNQVGKEITYFETGDYFGPDRRRMEVEPPKGIKRSAVPHSHTQLLFRRDPLVGTKLLRRLVILPPVREKTSHVDGQIHGVAGNWLAKDVAR